MKKKRDLLSKKNKKGMTSIEIVLSVLIVIMMIAGFVDLTVILRRGNVATTNTAYISRVVGNQGGLQISEIDNFNGRYVGSSEVYRNVKRSMNSSGISDDEWTATIYGVPLTPETNIPVFEYGTKIPITVDVEYEWSFTSNFIPKELKGARKSKAEVVTTHKIRDAGYSQR